MTQSFFLSRPVANVEGLVQAEPAGFTPGLALGFCATADEIKTNAGIPKWAEQVDQIPWRATTQAGLSAERLTALNRALANAQISCFSKEKRTFARSRRWKIGYGSSIGLKNGTLADTALSARGMQKYIHLSNVQETTQENR